MITGGPLWLCGKLHTVVVFSRILALPALQAAPLDARQAEASETEESDSGFHLLYELKPEQARAQFAVWQAAQPEDPMGRASEAAGYLFEAYFRQGPRGIFSRASERVGITRALKNNCFGKTRKLCPE